MQVAVHPADLIIGRGLITAETIYAALRQRLAERFGAAEFALAAPDLADEIQKILAEFEPAAIDNFMATHLAAWIAGADRVARSRELSGVL